MTTQTSTQIVHKTRFGMYCPLDYESYRKLRIIKAAANVSLIKARRHDKWGFKSAHNRSDNKPNLCSVFHVEKDAEFCWREDDGHGYKKKTRGISVARDTGMYQKVMDAWEAAQPKADALAVTPVKFKFDLDLVYNLVFPYWEEMCKGQSTQR